MAVKMSGKEITCGTST